MKTGKSGMFRAARVSEARHEDEPIGDAPSRPLRVLVLNERCHLNPAAGGSSVHLFEVFGRLASRGMQVELLCSGFPGCRPVGQHRGVRVTRIGGRLSYYARVPGEVLRRVKAGDVDVVVEELCTVPFLTPLYAKVPVLVTHLHLQGWTAFNQVPPWLAAGSVALESLLPWVYRRTPFVTISRSSKSDLVRRGLAEEHIDVVPCGIDHELLRPAVVEGRAPLIVAVGRVEPYKRLDLLLRAMPHVLTEVPTARLAILGRGQDFARLCSLATRLNLTRHVHFAGFTSDAEKVRSLQAAAIHVQCSRKEGWGLTVTEAYACGTPVVATDVPGLADSVQDGVTGLLVRRATPAKLAAAITRLLTDDVERSRLGHNALAWSRNFRWEPAAAAIERAAFRAACLAIPNDLTLAEPIGHSLQESTP